MVVAEAETGAVSSAKAVAWVAAPSVEEPAAGTEPVAPSEAVVSRVTAGTAVAVLRAAASTAAALGA